MAAVQWATAAEVKERTGVEVDEITRTLAAQGIELKCGLIEGVTRTGTTSRDRYWLKLAVCYQAAWLAAQSDYLERSDVTAASADGQSADLGPDALQLAPMARTAILRLSWMSGRTINFAGPSLGRAVSPLISDTSERQHWQPL